MNKQEERVNIEIQTVKTTLSKNIKYYRKAKRISQQKLADLCGLHRTYISDLENSKCNPTIEVLIIIADCLEIKLIDLLGLA